MLYKQSQHPFYMLVLEFSGLFSFFPIKMIQLSKTSGVFSKVSRQKAKILFYI